MPILTDTRRILIVDDNPDIHADYRKILCEPSTNVDLQAVRAFFAEEMPETPETNANASKPTISLDFAFSGKEGLSLLRQGVENGQPHAMAFVDMRMPPGWDGLTTCAELWKFSPDLQIVICTAYTDNTWEDIVQRFGCTDSLLVLKKPFEKIEVTQLAIALTEKWNLTKKAYLKQLDLERLVDERTQQLQHAALHDPLTDLPNRRLLNMRLTDTIISTKRDRIQGAFILIDLDRFKDVNDSMGHPAGDELLIQIAERLRGCVRESDMVARIGGDEFAVVLSDDPHQFEPMVVIERLQRITEEPFLIEGQAVHCGISLGIARIPYDGSQPDELLRKADLALYLAKQTGRGRFCVFQHDMDTSSLVHRQLQCDLRRAMENHQFDVNFQPVFETATNSALGFKALLNWTHPQYGEIALYEFLHLAESIGLLQDLQDWFLHVAFCEAATWPSDKLLLLELFPHRLQEQPNLAKRLGRALDASQLPPQQLEVEVSERLFSKDDKQIANTLNSLRQLGVTLVLGDFGVGYYSISNLHRFPFDKLKLDTGFVDAMHSSAEAQTVAQTIARMTLDLGLKNEFHEIASQQPFQAVLTDGFTKFRGLHYGPPAQADDIRQLLAEPDHQTLIET